MGLLRDDGTDEALAAMAEVADFLITTRKAASIYVASMKR